MRGRRERHVCLRDSADTEAVIDRLDDVVKAQSELDAYVFDLIEKRSKEPTGDLLS